MQHILALLATYRYALIFPISIIEGPIITILAGFLASLGSVNLYVAYVVVVAGDMVGDSIYYCIGRFGRKHFIHRWGKFFNITEEKVIGFESRFAKHETWILLVGKTQPIGSLALTTAGFIKMRFDKFIFISLVGTAIKSAILLAIGFYFGRAYATIDNYITKGGVILTLIAVVLCVVYTMNFRRKKQ